MENMKTMRLVGSILLLCICALSAVAQPFSAETEQLNMLYQEFRYQEVIRQGEAMLVKATNLTVVEKCEIFRLVALSYYTRQDMQGALKNFSEIVKLDSNYRLDPVKNSPKILAFFEEIRRQILDVTAESAPQEKDRVTVVSPFLINDSLQQAAYQRMALSVVVPGSGQIWRGQKTKGWLLLGGNVALLSASIYFAVETNRLNDQYLQTTDQDEIARTYDEYNKAYQKRNLALAGFVIVWLYTQIDFLFLGSPKGQPGQVSWYPNLDKSGRTSVTIAFAF
jgi:hypothetical protein